MKQTNNNIVNAAVAAYEKGVNAVVEEKTGRKCFAFALYVGGELSKIITAGCWLTDEQAGEWANGMSLAALAFKKSASVAVYELQDNDVYQLVTTRNSHHNEHTIFKIHRSRIKGAEYTRPTSEEDNDFMSLEGWADLPFTSSDALPLGWSA